MGTCHSGSGAEGELLAQRRGHGGSSREGVHLAIVDDLRVDVLVGSEHRQPGPLGCARQLPHVHGSEQKQQQLGMGPMHSPLHEHFSHTCTPFMEKDLWRTQAQARARSSDTGTGMLLWCGIN